jgi:DNA mismatch endonuclease (patch repair protein)
MTDRVSRAERSAMMAAVRGKNTEPEKLVRSILFRAGYRFRLHRRDLPGCPDIVLPRYRTVVFVHGCFWHGHDCRRGKLPTTNTGFWRSKIKGNALRDATNAAKLTETGWLVFNVWTCRIESDTALLLECLHKVVRTKEAGGV